MAEKLQEKLDYSFSFKDFKKINEYMNNFISDRRGSFQKYFIEYNAETAKNFKKTCQDYIEYFVANDGKESHSALYRIIHFINRPYEVFSLPEIEPLISRLKFLFSIPYEEIDDFEEFISEYEVDTIQEIEEIWASLNELLASSPRIIMSDLQYIQKGSIQIYVEPNADTFIVQTISNLAEKMVESFPLHMSRLDSFFIVNKDYINFACGVDDDSVMAFYLEDHIFFPSHIDPNDKDFFLFSVWHEAGHFIFELMSEASQELWYSQYQKWEEKGVKLSRIGNNDNEVEECFADAFSYIYGPLKTVVEDFVQPPSQIVMNTVRSLIEEEFNKNQPIPYRD